MSKLTAEQAIRSVADAYVKMVSESYEDDEGSDPDWHGGEYVHGHDQASKPSENPKPDDHVHSKAIANHGWNSQSFKAHAKSYSEKHPLVTAHRHEGDPDHSVSYSGPRHAVAAAVQSHHDDNEEASRYGKPPVKALHPEVFGK